MRYHPDYLRSDEGYRPKLVGSRISRRAFPSAAKAVEYRVRFFDRMFALPSVSGAIVRRGGR